MNNSEYTYRRAAAKIRKEATDAEETDR